MVYSCSGIFFSVLGDIGNKEFDFGYALSKDVVIGNIPVRKGTKS